MQEQNIVLPNNLNKNKKPICAVMAPYGTRSGYGAHSRDLISSLIKSNKYDLRLLPLNWGNTPMNALDDSNDLHKKMIDLTTTNLNVKPDIFIHITIPLEFKQVGKCNIGIYAGIETDREAPEWIDLGNKMDGLIVPSNHSKNIHLSSVYDLRRKKDGPPVGKLENEVDIDVLFEGVDTNIFKEIKKYETPKELKELDSIKEDFCFLSVGHWLRGKHRHDRKDVSGLVENFIKAFTYEEIKPGLILKTSGANFSLMDREELKKKIEIIRNNLPDKDEQPNIYIVHGNLLDSEMNYLYNHPKVKAFISCTHGEGYGRPIAEFIGSTNKPVLVSNWSGHLDFVKKFNNELLFDIELREIDESATWDKVIIQHSNWAFVNDSDVQNKLMRVYKKYNTFIPTAKKLHKNIVENLTLSKMQQKFLQIINKHYNKKITKTENSSGQYKNLNIPSLKKVGNIS